MPKVMQMIEYPFKYCILYPKPLERGHRVIVENPNEDNLRYTWHLSNIPLATLLADGGPWYGFRVKQLKTN